MLAGATCRAEVNCTQYDNSVPNTDGCAQSVDHHLQVTLLQMQCSADSRRRVEFAWHVQNWRQHLGDDEPFIADELTDLQNSSDKKALFMDGHSSWQVLVLLLSTVSQLCQEGIWGPCSIRYHLSAWAIVSRDDCSAKQAEAMFAPGLLKDRAPNYEVGGESHKILKNSKSNLLNVLLKEKTVKINVRMSNFFFKNWSKMAYMYGCLTL